MRSTLFVKWILIFTLALLSFESYPQTVPDSRYYKRLYYLCKVWGHAKYYHSEIAKGNVNWDKQLLDAVDQVKNATTNNDYNAAIETLLNNAGEMEPSSVELPVVPDSLNNNLDLDWVYDPIFSETVSAILDTITQRFRPQSNVYVNPYVTTQPEFDDDNAYYSEGQYPTEGKRIVALYRYWNIIQYFFPYKNIMDQSWDTTLVEFIPEIVGANNVYAYHLAFKELTTRINDTHAFFSSDTFNRMNGFFYPPFQVRFIENETVITKVLDGITTISLGDIIKEIDGQDIYELRDSLRRYAHGSNRVVVERTVNSFIIPGSEGPFQVMVDNGSNTHTETLVRNNTNSYDLYEDEKPVWDIDYSSKGCQIGIVNMGLLEMDQVDQMFDDLWLSDAIIFDVRNYPKGAIFEIVDYLYNSSIDIANFTVPDITYPGRFYWHTENIGSGTANSYLGKVIILFDERTQSHAEFTCMGLEQVPGSIKIGSTTSAADGNVAKIYLPGGILTYATFLGTYYPDYTPTQRIGIIPDIEVLPTILGIKKGEDEIMNYALNLVPCEVTGIYKPIETQFVSLYPNPASQSIHYKLLENDLMERVLFNIFDVQGRQIKSINKLSGNGEIDISNFKSGIYLLKIIIGKRIHTKTFIRE